MTKLKKGPKIFNVELLFLHAFSSKNHEILHKAILTHQKYEDHFSLKKKAKKNLFGVPADTVCLSQDWYKKLSPK